MFDWIKRLGAGRAGQVERVNLPTGEKLGPATGDPVLDRIAEIRVPPTLRGPEGPIIDRMELETSVPGLKERAGSPAGRIAAGADAFSPLPGDCGNEDGEEAPIRHALVWYVVGTAEELDQVNDYVNSIDDGQGMTDTEADLVRDAYLEALDEVEAEPTFTYDMAGSGFAADNGDDVDVYVVRGDKEALARFNKSVTAVGGECGSVGLDGVTVAADALAILVKSECEGAEDGAEEMLAKADHLADQAAKDLGSMELDARIGKLEAKRSRGYLKQSELNELIDYRVAQRLMTIGMAEVQTATASLAELGFGAFTPADLVAWKNAVAKNHARMLVWTPFRPDHDETSSIEVAFQDLRGKGASVAICQGLKQSREVAEIKEWAQEWNEKHGGAILAEAEPATWADPAPKRRSPCYLRRKERQKFGVRKAQLEKLGGNPEQAAYISDRVKHMQRQGVGMVEAIEQAQTEWLVKEGQWDGLDLLNRRREVGLTVPRLVVEGYGSEHAQFLIARVDYFGSEGVAFSEALNWAEYLWAAKQSGEAEEIQSARDRIGGWFAAARKQQIVNQIVMDDAESVSAADWIGQVAADLREEYNHKTGRLFTKEEALGQALREWCSMTPAARIGVRFDVLRSCGVGLVTAQNLACIEEAKFGGEENSPELETILTYQGHGGAAYRFFVKAAQVVLGVDPAAVGMPAATGPTIEAGMPAYLPQSLPFDVPVIEAIPPAQEFDPQAFLLAVAVATGIPPEWLTIPAPGDATMPAPFDYVSGCCDGCDQALEKDLDVTLAGQEMAEADQAEEKIRAAVRQAVRVRELQMTKEELESPDAWKLLYIAGLKVRGFSTDAATWITNRRGVLGKAGFADKEAVTSTCEEFNVLQEIDPSGNMTMVDLFAEEAKHVLAFATPTIDVSELTPAYVQARLAGNSRFSSARIANGR